MHRFSIWLFLLFATIGQAQAQTPKLVTTAEHTKYRETTSSADVIAFGQELAKLHPTTVQYLTYGTSHGGKPLPLIVIGDNKPTSAPAPRRGPRFHGNDEPSSTAKPCVLVYANIHAGEVDGKEAVLALARDLAGEAGAEMRKKFRLLIAPNINPDGNDKLGPAAKHRPGQNGPDTLGVRENNQGLDLNRDFIKLESPEIRALVKLVNERDPLVIVDCHTTNGSRHRYGITYDGPRHAAANPALIAFSHSTFLPAVTDTLKAEGVESFYYGNFNKDKSAWETYPTTPRFGTQYFALRNRFGLLCESYTYDSFEKRVACTRAFVNAVLEQSAKTMSEIQRICTDADKARPKIVLQTKLEKYDAPVTVLGLEKKVIDGQPDTFTPKDYVIPFIGKSVATQTIDRPAAYRLENVKHRGKPMVAAADGTPVTDSPILANLLRRHGVPVEEIREQVFDAEIGALVVDTVDTVEIGWERSKSTKLGVHSLIAKRELKPGDFYVRTDHRLGTLAAFLLEPESEDGFATWHLYDYTPGGSTPHPVRDGTKLLVSRVASDAVFTGAMRPLPEDVKKDQPITPETWYGGKSFGGTPVGPITWLPDGEYWLQTKNRKLWKVHALSGGCLPIFDAKLFDKSLATVTGLPRLDRERMLNGDGLRYLPDYTAVLVTAKANTWVAYLDGTAAKQLTKGDDLKEFVTLSADGKSVGYVKAGNLFSIDIATLTETQHTTDGGKNDILNGKNDWVYFEEIFNRNYQAFWWSPKNDAIAFLRFDDSMVKKFTIADPASFRGKAEVYAYPKVGDPNPTVKIGVARPGSSEPVFLDLAAYKPEDMLVSRVGWTPDGHVYACIQNRTQTRLDFVVWKDGKPTVLFRETAKTWIEEPEAPRYLKDGSFLWLSDRSGYNHLYHYASDGKLLKQVTTGEWGIKAVQVVNENDGVVFFTANKDSPNGLDLYRVKINTGQTDRITSGGSGHRYGATHAASVDPTGRYYIERFSNNTAPTRAILRVADTPYLPNGRPREPLRILDDNPAYEREAYSFGKFERVQIAASEGFLLEASITYPPGFDASKKYPVWINTYAGPHAPQVRDAFGSGRVYEQMLAGLGIVSVTVDPRSASGKGATATWTCYKQLGVQELKDLETAVDWLTAKPWCDAKRVGLQGHSYGGYITCYALTHCKKFAAGIAGAPVTDWRLYDSIYTERYMGLPEENKEGYDRSSCLTAAANLSGKLLILHGQIDDNVHIQNTLQFADALQKANKPFELMIYPGARHGLFGRHYQEIQVEFIRRTMVK